MDSEDSGTGDPAQQLVHCMQQMLIKKQTGQAVTDEVKEAARLLVVLRDMFSQSQSVDAGAFDQVCQELEVSQRTADGVLLQS